MGDNDKQYWVQPDGTRIPVETTVSKSASVTGSSAKAAALKVQISGILMDAICGDKEKYRTHDGFIRWGVVEGDINETIDAALR